LRRSFLRLLAVGLLALSTAGCGYHVAGRAASLPNTWHTIAIPAFVNRTSRYRIEQRLTEGVIQEFLQRTSYRIVQDPKSADAVLTGEVKNIETSSVLFDQTTGRATTVLITVTASVQLTDRATGKVVYHNDSIIFRDEYQISVDVSAFFEEQDPALGRMAHDFGGRVVSAILENF
jgi:outer membrane lipopolysaccharide assembly protein LptE/RlpB